MTKLPRRRHPIESEFLSRAIQKAESAGFRVMFKPTTNLIPREVVRGLFYQHAKQIVIAARDPEWFHVFLHEFCHLEQLLEGLWSSHREYVCWELLDAWFSGKRELRADHLTRCVRTIQACELDAEKRAARYIRKYKFPSISLDEHIRSANVYVLSYEAKRRNRFVYRDTRFPRHLLDMVPAGFIRRMDYLPPGFLEHYTRKD